MEHYKIRKNSGKNNLSFTIKEKIIITIKSVIVISVIDYYFYKNIYAIFFLIPLGYIYSQKLKKEMITKKQQKLKLEFKELLLISSTGQKAGYSIENAMINSYDDLRELYGTESLICVFLKGLSNVRNNRQSISDYFIEFGESTAIEEIMEFGEIFAIAYEKSGNISAVMEKTAKSIIDKLETEDEIYLSLSERIYELRIMNLMPFLMMTYIKVTSNGYFESMYNNFAGIIVMTICLLLYITSYIWGNKIMEIKV